MKTYLFIKSFCWDSITGEELLFDIPNTRSKPGEKSHSAIPEVPPPVRNETTNYYFIF